MHQTQEALGESRRTFLVGLFDEERSDRSKEKLEGYVKLLDNLDIAIEKRISELEERLLDNRQQS